MDTNRRRDGKNEHNPHERDINQQGRKTSAPTGFEGMNFEQERGSYRDNQSHNLRKNSSGGKGSVDSQEEM